jgi:ketosteroid isomerase-like protein/TolB-like protein
MKEVFISHVEEDADLSVEIALALESCGHSTWCYEVDSVPGPTYFQQTRSAVTHAKVVVVIISPRSIGSQQITRELVCAFELNKAFIPILRDITHAEFQDRQPEWRDILGAAASIRVPAEGISALAPRIVQGLRQLGVSSVKPDPARIADMEAMRHRPTRRRRLFQLSGSILGTRFRIVLLAIALVSVAALALVKRHTPMLAPPTHTNIPKPPAIAQAEGPLVMGVMDIRAQGKVPEWMREFTRDGLNTVLSKAPKLKVFSKQKIDFVREKRGLSEIEAAEQLGIAKMISGTLSAREDKFVLELQVVDIQSGLLEDSERIEGAEAELVALQNRAAVNMVRAMNVVLSSDDVNRMFARTNDSLDSYKLLTETLVGSEEQKPSEQKPHQSSDAWVPWVAIAYADEMKPDEAAVRQLLEKYRAALEAKDLDRLATVQEDLSEGQRQALLRYFDNAHGLKIQFSNLDILVEGDEALATFTRDDVFKDVRSGREMHLEVRMSSVLAKQAGGWRIRALKKPS